MDREKAAVKERNEYFEKLRVWLDEGRLWYYMAAGLPPCIQQGVVFPNEISSQLFAQLQANANANPGGVPFYQTYPSIHPPNLIRVPTTFEFRIPPLWKRLCAELIDFAMLLTVKLAITFLLIEGISFGKAFELYGLESIQKGILEGKEVNFPVTFEIILLEILHRIIVCAFETCFLKGKSCATPGKKCMGLMVVRIEGLTGVPNRPVETVLATGVKAPGWQRAFIRSVLKNLVIGLLVPLCITFYIFPFNRTSYDMMSNCLVVEAHSEFLVYQSIGAR